MSAGYNKDKATVDNALGSVCQSINREFRRAGQLKTELDAVTDQQLVGLGYTAGEVTAIRTAITDLAALGNIYAGTIPLAVAKDFRVSLRPLWGIGGDF